MYARSQIRQYFLDSSFYIADVTERGWCKDDGFPCEAFSPSSATVKVRPYLPKPCQHIKPWVGLGFVISLFVTIYRPPRFLVDILGVCLKILGWIWDLFRTCTCHQGASVIVRELDTPRDVQTFSSKQRLNSELDLCESRSMLSYLR